MGILGSRNIFDPAAMFGILFSKLIGDEFRGLRLSDRTNTGGIGTHIGNQTLYTTCSQADALIELLGHHHGLAGSEIELVGSIHLHGGSRVR